jgi:predicted phosphodiesterase
MPQRTIRILPISDIHMERRKLKEIPALDQPFDVLACAGDLYEGQPEMAIQSVVALARGKPSIIVPGNQDLYTNGPEDRRTISEFVRLLRNEAERQNARAHRDIPRNLNFARDRFLWPKLAIRSSRHLTR